MTPTRSRPREGNQKPTSQTRCPPRTEKHQDGRARPFNLGKRHTPGQLGRSPPCPIPRRGDMKRATVFTVHPGVDSQENGGREGSANLNLRTAGSFSLGLPGPGPAEAPSACTSISQQG